MSALASAFSRGNLDGQSSTERALYVENGYIVIRHLVPQSKIQFLLSEYHEHIVPSRYPFFRQSTNRYEPNEVSNHGFVRQSFLDIHDYGKFPEFSRTARDIYCTESVIAALRRITGFDAFALMQTMLFDLNTETPGHQDWYYLDSVPNGNLIAAWIALEDINERAGRFFVLPGSQNLDFGPKAPGRTHEDWLAQIREHIDSHREQISSPALNAGDVLFWNSRTVHGSLPTQDESHSRKSLTAHYLPGGFEFGNLFSVKPDPEYKDHHGIRFYRNQPDFSQWNRLKFAIKTRAYNNPLIRETLRAARNAISRNIGPASGN